MLFERLSVFPFMVWLIVFQGAPLSVLGGIIQDVAFGLWTARALAQMPAAEAAERPEMPANATLFRLVLVVVGVAEVRNIHTVTYI